MGAIYVAGTAFEVDARVVPWFEGPRWDARQERCVEPSQPCRGGVIPFSSKLGAPRRNRMALRPALRGDGDHPSLAGAQAVIRQFVLHHDGCPDAASCWNVLHNERGLSCHFILDNDGTLYQTLDLAFMGFHAAQFNAHSIGVEMCNRGDAKLEPHYYERRGQRRGVATCRIHGHTYLAFEFTPAQQQTMKALVTGLRHALPELPLAYPQAAPGQQAWTVLPDPASYAGLLGHYHLTTQKWDPGPFDFKALVDGLRGRQCFPLAGRGERAEVPDDADAVRQRSAALCARNEAGEFGFFPVGREGGSRLWHGGIHLPAARGAPVVSPFAGRVVAARAGGRSAVGSTDFALVRHDLALGPHALRLHTLVMHLDDPRPRARDAAAPAWLRRAGLAAAPTGRVVLLDEPIAAGEVLGWVGEAGPADRRTSQIHLEIVARDELGQAIAPGRFRVIDGSSSGRFLDDAALVSAIDRGPRDGRLSSAELAAYFHGGEAPLARDLAALFVSEWTATPDWAEALALAPEFAGQARRTRDQLIADQITPGLWWDDEVAAHAGLPRDGMVYHYHPIALIALVNLEQLAAAALADVGVGAFAASEARARPADVLGDIDDQAGQSFLDAGELGVAGDDHELTLEELAAGYPE